METSSKIILFARFKKLKKHEKLIRLYIHQVFFTIQNVIDQSK